jgi:hypothetical protein
MNVSTDLTLPFRVDQFDNGRGYFMPWLTHNSGVRRIASTEEAALWDALEAAKRRIAELEAAETTETAKPFTRPGRR